MKYGGRERGEVNEVVEKNWLPRLIKYVDKLRIKYTRLSPARAQVAVFFAFRRSLKSVLS